MNFGLSVVLLVSACVCSAAADKWRFPETASSIRIDTKVGFVDRDQDNGDRNNNGDLQSDEPAFEPAIDTSGFYNRPANAPGRYPVRVQSHDAYRAPYKGDGQGIYSVNSVHQTPQAFSNDGTLETLKYCKCVSTPECNPSVDSAKACGSGKFLCCYKRTKTHQQSNSEIFNELEDERPELHPGQSALNGPFPLPPGTNNNYYVPERGHGIGDQPRRPAVLVGPDGPTGNIGPPKIFNGVNQPNISPANPGVLVGPNGPTGIIGLTQHNYRPNEHIRSPQDFGHNSAANPGVLVGPNGPTGIIGPKPHNNRPHDHNRSPQDFGHNSPANPGVLVGPNGPTGIIGPKPHDNRPHDHNRSPQDLGQDETAQRGILVGPGGPTGIIGPGYGRRPVLVGPGGPTGIIGPFGYGRNQMRNPGVLVGPGGPTGIVGPGRGVLVGPGGPTGQIGPRNPYFFRK